MTDVGDDPAYFTVGYGGSLLAVVSALDLVVTIVLAYDPREPQADVHALEGSQATELVSLSTAPHVVGTASQR